MTQEPRASHPPTSRYSGLRALSSACALALLACSGTPRVEVRPLEGTTTSESGGIVRLTVWLSDAPASPIEVRAVSSDETEGKASAPIVFDATNYNQRQALYVRGVDDGIHDGDIGYDVDIYARPTSSDHSWLVRRLHLVNRDDDIPVFEALGHLPDAISSVATSVSADGSVVVGSSGAQAFRWTTQGMIGLGGPEGRAEAVSPDGRKIVGSVADSRFEKGRAAASFAEGQPFQLLAEPPQPGPDAGLLLYFVDATVVLDDGTAYGTCIQYGAYGEPLGCTKAAALMLAAGSYLYAADGEHYAGAQNAERHAPFSSWALFDGQRLPYPAHVLCDPPTGCQAAVRGFSAGGDVLVGTSLLPVSGMPLREFALRFSTVEGTTLLGDLDGGELASGAYAVSQDGKVIAGYGNDERGKQAVLWIDRMPRALEDVVLDGGGELPAGWSLREIRALSSDGRVLVGNGVNPEGNDEAFRVTLPRTDAP
ncbi:MAG TPA: hypothetical protein VI299_27200 [Polyangiales bacterium]